MEQEIIHKIIRSRRRTVGLQVTPDAQLVVRVPAWMSLGAIHEVVREKMPWILAKQRFAREHFHPRSSRTFSSGEKYLYFGEPYELSVVPGGHGVLAFEKDRFLIPEGCLPLAKWLFRDWYQDRAAEFFKDRVSHYAGILGVGYSGIRISNARQRWGSCSARGGLSFSWRLVMAPREVADYVVVHEVVHLIELNHSKRFWEKVGALAPEYRRVKKWLEMHQRTLDI